MSTTLYAYIAESGCTKCGGTDIADRFHRAPSSKYDFGPDCGSGDVCWTRVKVEHIRRHCRRCSHEWLCAPLDAVPASSSESSK